MLKTERINKMPIIRYAETVIDDNDPGVAARRLYFCSSKYVPFLVNQLRA